MSITLIKDYDFIHHDKILDYYEDGHHNCDSYGCDEEGICRCYSISEVNLEYVNLTELRKFIMKRLGTIRGRDLSFIVSDSENQINAYCVDRILHIYKLWERDEWDIDWGGDYYGDTVYGITIAKSGEIEGHIWSVLTMAEDMDKLRYVLNLEYGHILPEIDGVEVEMAIVDASDVVMSSRNRAKVLESFIHLESIYGDYDLPRGVCYEKNGKYVAVDGHTRISANKENHVMIYIIR